MARNKTAQSPPGNPVASYKYPSKRKNIPPAGLAAQGTLQEAPKLRYEYNPHLPPTLRSAPDAAEADRLPEYLEVSRKRALTDNEARTLAAALRKHEPWLEWSGKREKPWFEVEPVALHIHERVSTQAILRVLARQDVQRDLFADPQQSYAEAVQFYKYDVDWSNRLILGDSLQVMASLARREDLAGKVQMIYFDPPYGIKFSSNFQPQLGQRDVKDREQDLTREPEMVKAYRDTWTLGIHSYLAYLRDRLAMAKELLADTGSIFVQISDENLHRVRCLMDEVFKAENFVAQITVKKTSARSSDVLPSVADFLLWFAKDKQRIKFHPLQSERELTDQLLDQYKWVEEKTGHQRNLTEGERRSPGSIKREGATLFRPVLLTSSHEYSRGKEVIKLEGKEYGAKSRYWSTSPESIQKLAKVGRIFESGDSLNFIRCLDDFPFLPVTDIWTDTATGGGEDKIYVVQTASKIIERCLLMTTDPGDLVLDPTCGSGTTAFVAEHWGRRWITVDTSRVALALAKQRLLTARFPYYKLRDLSAEDLDRNPKGTWLKNADTQPKTFSCKTVSHITLKSIARNTSLDPIFSKHEPILAERLKQLNAALKKVNPDQSARLADKLRRKARDEGKKTITEADRRRWLLPGNPQSPIRIQQWEEWQVPFDTDPDWPKTLQEALEEYRKAWGAKMNEVNQCIAANAEMEELVDKPEEVPGIVRVSGPFTVEGVISVEEGPDTPIGGAPDPLETFIPAADASAPATAAADVQNVEAHLDKVIRLLKASGVDFPATPQTPARNMKFARLEPMTGASMIHAEGEWLNGDQKQRRVAVTIGPDVGNITAYQVEDVIRDANRKGYDDVVFAAFGFDAAAQDAIEGGSHPKVRLHMALIRPDVAMGDLLKTQPGSQLFTVFSAPRIKGPEKQSDGTYQIEVEGMDVYDPVSNTLFPTDKERIAAWWLDSDYDGRTFCICQAFFPDKSKWDKLARALGDRGIISEDAFSALSGLKSLPFPKPARLKKGEKWRVAVKVIDPRGNEGMRVVEMP
jgi:adenine-specific DNA-methyltransferase